MAAGGGKSYDLIVIGSGPGGYTAAVRASQLGMKTAIVERSELGGICLNWGCIPTKALLRSAEIYNLMRRASEFGLSAGEVGYDWARVIKRSRDVADRMSKGVAFLMKKNGIEVLTGGGPPGRNARAGPGRWRGPLLAEHPDRYGWASATAAGRSVRRRADPLLARSHDPGRAAGANADRWGRGDRRRVRLLLRELRNEGDARRNARSSSSHRG